MRRIPQILIGASASGGGKTTFTTGLLRLLRDRGLTVQPYKCGPDYIDTKYHEMASGRVSVNLDSWLASEEHLKQIYAKYASDADVCVTEGVMGLFDGFEGMRGSSASIAALLGIPVVLVVDARSTAYTVAAILYGFKHFYPAIRIAGAVFNQVASERHFSFLCQACEDVGVECFGYLPRLKELEVPSRHLGLTLDATYRFDEFAGKVAAAIGQSVDVDRLLRSCSSFAASVSERPKAETIASASVTELPKVGSMAVLPSVGEQSNLETIASTSVEEVPNEEARCPKAGRMRIAVARDAAFNFIYRENLARLEEWGTVTFFSPMADEALPEADFVYLPGGYPEFFLESLANNESLKSGLRAYVEAGGHMLAECGGMMYLCDSIRGMDGKDYPMVGLLHQQATMEDMKLRLGYRTIRAGGQIWKGHEFHYSSVSPGQPPASIAVATDARGNTVDTPLYRYKNLIAGYTHLYWGGSDLMKLWEV
ncbi:cobyrinate a,c-diamide synthase [Bacteroides pyogenes]|uniref:cobyrinate a,c-diamide synthase n=1 Tax=Bacteroides pyogenes TaxID=310300 RepID=UPI001BAAA199|nr:cobyrinate a,c-diamide synthase [Bacteroides pyogenes]MBR8724885.1 Cobyrinate a,c-diamide synthase [Bacteroides pyogenes]MBR8738445.1 Cobyrinate a,c-diamide synthase [Bacteroides pyogenes]MBR8754097.1 Cobyrinate a,c-diamide synthase [Bacteroides pyogenes]MBR8795530.1 Cobyrinate a,c-diamide synthase [Bacteroides pyogenes]MBR8808833.1 Cobyrinate a,c-diamide synthase [Bacteroides pyogenes]